MSVSVRTAAVVAVWDADATPAVLDRIRTTYAVGGPVTVLAVGNSPEAMEAAAGHADLVIAGTNADAEFSAYDEGLSALRAARAEADVLVVANDRAFSYPSPQVRGAVPRLLDHVARHRLAAGHLDALPRSMTVMGRSVRRYLRSNLLVLPFQMPSDFTLTSVPTRLFDEVVPVEYPGSWRLGRLAAPQYEAFVGSWLTATSGPDRWHRARPLTEDSWPALRQKVKSIVNEHLLTGRLGDAGLVVTSVAHASSWTLPLTASPIINPATTRASLAFGALRARLRRVDQMTSLDGG